MEQYATIALIILVSAAGLFTLSVFVWIIAQSAAEKPKIEDKNENSKQD